MKFKNSFSKILLIGCLLLPLAVAGQKKQTQVVEDLTFPGEKHKLLDAFVGEWDVTAQYKTGPGKMTIGTATCVTKWILDGRFLQQEYSSELMGKPFSVLQIIGFDRKKRHFFQIHLNSQDTGGLYAESKQQRNIAIDSKVLTFFGSQIDPLSDKTGVLKTVFTINSSDQFTIEWFFTEKNRKEEKVVSLLHTRRKS